MTIVVVQTVLYQNIINTKILWTDMSVKRNVSSIPKNKSNIICQKFKNYKNKQRFLREFNIPHSTYYYLRKKENDKNLKYSNCNVADSSSHSNNNEVWNFIKFVIKPPQKALTIENIRNKVHNAMGVSLKKREIKKFLKEKMRYSYRKGWSTSQKVKSSSHWMQRSIYYLRIFEEIYIDKLIINIDESWF